VGTKTKAVGTFLGMKLEAAFEITAFEPNRSYTYKGGAGPAVGETTMRFEPVGAGTRLSVTFHMEPGGLFKIAEPLLISQIKKQWDADGQRLKALLEAQQG
jgi:carbon monoxide dehydrogenase subunit G